MKKDFEIRIVAKGCDKEIKEGMGKGVLISQVVTLTLPDEMDEKAKERIGFQLYDMGKDLMDEEFKIEAYDVEELEAEKEIENEAN